jgi:hypothetical protein
VAGPDLRLRIAFPLILGAGLFLLSACATVSPAETGRARLETFFFMSREALLDRLPAASRAATVIGDNEITITHANTRNLYNMLITVKTETVIYRFTSGRLTRIEIRTSSETGALDADLADMRSLYRSLDARNRSRLGAPANDVKETAPAVAGGEMTTVALFATNWTAVPKREYLPDLDVSLEFRERSLMGTASIRIREIYEMKQPGQ